MTPHLEWYLEQTRKFPLLDVDEEQRLARDWRQAKDPAAAEQLETSKNLGESEAI
jgi:DNA-directed RNA polymerase sigma subunit (sigma70/sigma32)